MEKIYIPSEKILRSPADKEGALIPSLINVVIFLLLFGNVYAAIFEEISGVNARSINVVFKGALSCISTFLILVALHENRFLVSKKLIYLWVIFLLSALCLSYLYIQQEPIRYINSLEVYGIAIGAIVLPVSAIIASSKKVGKIHNWLFFWLIFTCLALAILADSSGRMRLSSFNPISVSMLGGFLVLLCIFKWSYSKINKLFILLVAALGLYILISGASRSSLLGVILAIIFMCLIKKPKLTLSLSPLLAYLFFVYILPAMHSRLNTVSDSSTSERLSIYIFYYSAILNNFVLPMVPFEYSLIWAHNIFLSVYSSSSIFGIILFICIIMYCLKVSFRLIKLGSDKQWISLFFVFILTISFFSGALLDFYFWIILALVIVCARQERVLLARN